MAPTGKVVKTARGEAHLYVAKAAEFSAAAGEALARGQRDAALLLSVHAGISAADSVAIALAGLRSADPDHQRAVDLIEQVARGSDELRQKASQLRALIQKKNLVEYESRRASASEARDGTQRAARLVTWAETIVTRARV